MANGPEPERGQPHEWDAGTYHRVSAPQHAWGLRVLERLELRGGERVLDAGCGTGRVTQALHAQVRGAGGHVIALDRSVEMTRVARRTLPAEVPVVAGDLLALPLRRAFDVVFSTATFHWVLDPAALYRNVAGVLSPGGRLHAQCGGAGNLARLLVRVYALAASQRFARYVTDWSDPWRFLAPAEAEAQLQAAGFTRSRAWLEPEPTRFASREAFRTFVEHVVLGAWMVRFADDPAAGSAFLDAVCDAAAIEAEPYTLDYVRLNLEGTLAGGTA